MKKIFILIHIVLFLASCSEPKTEEKIVEKLTAENVVTLSSAQFKNAAIATGKAEQKPISSVLELTGAVDVPPENIVSISFPLGGYLKSTKLLAGMPVRKGQVLAIIEDPQIIQLQQDYLSTKAKFVYAEKEFIRQRELNQSKASSDKLFQQAEAEFANQKIMMSSLAQKLKLIGISPAKLSTGNISRSANVYSPISGFVAEVKVNIGKYVNPADVLFDIINPNDIHLALNVFEKDITNLAIGQNIIAYTNTNPAKKYQAKVMLIGRELSADRSIEVHCHFQNRDQALIPGMFMNAEVKTKSSNTWVLPADAIVNFENKQYVFIAKGNNSFEMVEVKTGSSENGFTALVSGDALAKQAIVVKGAYSLLMALKNTSDE